MKTRPPSFSMGTFQGTPASFSPMAAPGSTASPSSAAYPNLSGRSAGFSECSMGCWGGRRGAAPHKAQPGCTPCSLLVGAEHGCLPAAFGSPNCHLSVTMASGGPPSVWGLIEGAWSALESHTHLNVAQCLLRGDVSVIHMTAQCHGASRVLGNALPKKQPRAAAGNLC